MGVFPMVLWKNSSSIRSEVTKRSEGRSRSSFPNLQTGHVSHPQAGSGSAVCRLHVSPGRLAGVV